jgi:hypothetical protein
MVAVGHTELFEGLSVTNPKKSSQAQAFIEKVNSLVDQLWHLAQPHARNGQIPMQRSNG